MTEGRIVEVNDDSFESVIREGVTLIDCFAEWCGPCKMLTPVLEEVAGELEGQVTFAKLDIDKNSTTVGNLSITSVPTLILFKNGEKVGELVGLRDAAAVKDFALSATS